MSFPQTHHTNTGRPVQVDRAEDGTISFHDRPAKKITARPAASTSSEVPRSGCFMIRPTGTASRTKETTKSSGRS